VDLAFDVGTLSFAEPDYLWLLAVPAVLVVLWAAQLLRRRADAGRYARARVIPVRERYTSVGDLPFWLCLLVAVSLCILALARPQARVWVPGTAGADFVILQDGSSSMYVGDIAPDRWRRSMQFLRTFAETLNWRQDRAGLALFAYFAAPQLRLTRDPNALFFFLDRLSEQSPFRLEDDPTWNTNIEQAVDWGLRLIETNEELFGRTNNPKALVVVSDGQAWSGRVASALAAARNAGVAVHVVGVGTTAGGLIPETAGRGGRLSRIQSALDRNSLREVARAGGGEYFELGSEPDRDIAARLISTVRRRAPAAPREERSEELYWRFLVAAAVILCPGTLVLGHRTEWCWQAAGALAAILILSRLQFGF
jgi:Ca-activated chloride channel family protein